MVYETWEQKQREKGRYTVLRGCTKYKKAESQAKMARTYKLSFATNYLLRREGQPF
jgi:hypothetical protein